MRVRRRVLRLLLFVGLVASALGALAGPALAEVELKIDVGYDGNVQSGRPYPLIIEISTDSLVSGELRITGENAPFAFSREIEVPGGTTRKLVMVVQSSPWDSGGGAQVELVSGGQVVAKATVRAIATPNTELVGVLPVIANRGLPEKAELRVGAGDARLVALELEDLARGPGALGPLDTIVLTGGDLRSLEDGSLDALFAWVNGGGRLLIDEALGTRVSQLPEAWQPEGAEPKSAGLGEIVLTNGDAAAGNWDLILEPAPTKSRQDDEAFGEFGGFWGGEPLSLGLGRDAGFALPDFGWLSLTLGAYVVLAGPATWLLVRYLRRPSLAWVGVPVVALVFTAGIWVLGASFRNGTEAAHGTIVEVSPRGSTATTFSLLNSRGGGSKSVMLPPAWSVVSSFNEGRQPLTRLADEDGGSSATVELDAGGFALVGATGSMPDMDSAVEVVAWSNAADRVFGTISNNLDVDLHEVGVLVDLGGENIGTVPARSQVDFEFVDKSANGLEGEPIEFDLWRDALSPQFFGGFGGEFDPGPVNIGLWNELVVGWSFNSRPVGHVMVVGWTDELASPLDADVAAGRTLVLARGEIQPDGDLVSNVAVTRTIVRGSQDLGQDFRANEFWGSGAMVRFVVPRGTASRELGVSAPVGIKRLELWVLDEWRDVVLPEGPKPLFLLPADALVDGRVYVKVLLDFERGFPQWRDLAVRSPLESEQPLPVVYASDESVDEEAVG